MMINWTKIAAVVVSTASLAGTASAELIAGWDFSQYRVDGSLDAGGGATDTLPANYSSLDLTFGAGGTDPGDSADFGTLLMNGSLGSTDVNELAPSPGPEVVAHANETQANRLAPLDMAGANPGAVNVFDAFNVLLGEGQANQSRVGLTARAPASLVFQVDILIFRLGDIDFMAGQFWDFLATDPRLLTVLTATALLAYPMTRIAWFLCYIDLRVRRDCWDLELGLTREAARLRETA